MFELMFCNNRTQDGPVVIQRNNTNNKRDKWTEKICTELY